MAISDDWTIDLSSSTIRRLYHSSGTTVYTLNQLYSYLMDFFDESGTIDDTIPMTAQTPTAYTLTNGWFIDYTSANNYLSHRYLNGGSLQTSGWKATGFTSGIRILTFNSGGYSDPAAGDLGSAVDYAGGSPSDTGILLGFESGSRKWWVRVQNTSATYFSNTGTQVRANGSNHGTLSAASITGENIWSNPYTLGTIADNTQIYVVQNHARVTPWWSIGHIDILLLVKEADTFNNAGKATIMAREYCMLYDHYEAYLSDGSRSPIPLATSNDANNYTGYRSFTGTGGSGTFVAGEIISYGTTAYGILTAVNGYNLSYYLYRYNFTDFANGNAVIGNTSGATCTAGTPTTTGPAAYSGITITFGATSQNLNNGNGSSPYSVIVNCNNYPLANVYEYLKYYTRYGSVISLNGYDAEEYTAIGDQYLAYDTQSTNFVEGETINGATSAATGVVVSDHDSGAYGNLVLRTVTGTFIDNENLRSGSTVRAIANIPSGAGNITPVKQSPFGTFAGGQLFGARGVWFSNIPAADVNNFELIDTANTRQVPPLTISLSLIGLVTGDRVGIFNATGNNNTVNKSQYSIYAYQGSVVSYIRVSGVAPADTPSTGSICLVRWSGSSILSEERYSYTAWTSSTSYTEFTLSSPTTQVYTTTDTAYVPYLLQQASATSITQSLVYTADRYVTTRIRQLHYQPYMINGQITSSGLSVSAVNTTDAIAD